VLVVGSSVKGEGMEPLFSTPALELVETDVAFGADVSVICDAHDLPFAENSFDGVVIQAVLEHVVDPYRCVAEVHRVLQPAGVVYSETPFMQQVHLGRYDFTRFTHLGHQRLFRNFTEVASGPVCGSGMALAWSYQYFLLSFVKSPTARALMKVIARLTGFWLKYFDYLTIDRAGSYDAASGYYFLGTKSDRTLSDRELLAQYKGAQASSF
jgi:SAM-dependent methyltransferase